MVKKILKYAYDWKTLMFGFLFFIVAYFVANILFTSFGGCAGCISDGTGGVTCVNECKKTSPVFLALLSYITSYLIMIIFSFIKKNDKQNIA